MQWSCAGLLAVIVVAAGATCAAWACVPQPLIVVQPNASGRPGAHVTVSGINFPLGVVEIRWNGLEGPKLAESAAGSDFSLPVTIPTAAEGLYTLVGVGRAPDGSVAGTVARAAFLVPGGPGPAASGAPDSNTGSLDGRSTATGDSSTKVNPFAAAAGGAGLVAIGGVGGALMARRRRPTTP